jgi:hypothetical protein
MGIRKRELSRFNCNAEKFIRFGSSKLRAEYVLIPFFVGIL